MNRFRQDIRYALRTLSRAPAFSAIVMLTLALGIGANVAIFSVVYAVVLQPLPYPRANELVALYESLPPNASRPARPRTPIAPPTVRDWAEASSFAGTAYYAEGEYIITGENEPERLAGADVSHTFFDTLGVVPLLGRFFTDDDDSPNRPLVCVIGSDLWRGRFGADPLIIGKSIELDGRRHSVIGIAPAEFALPEGGQVWLPLALPESAYLDGQRRSFYLGGIGRLKPQVSRAEAATELNIIAGRLVAQFPDIYGGRGATVDGLHDSVTARVKRPLLILLGTAGCVLLIACLNVASLMLVRAASREGEMATRVALGASRSRIMQQLLTETGLLAVAGGAGGVLLAYWLRDSIVNLSPANVPRITQVQVDTSTLLFALFATSLSIALCGVAPALASGRSALWSSLSRAGGWKGVAGLSRPRVHAVLVVTQLALSLALLAGAGVLARSFWALTSVNPGFSSTDVLTMEVILPGTKYSDRAQRVDFFRRLLERLQAHPLVQAAGGSTNLPLSGTNMSFGFFREEMSPSRDAPLSANVRGTTSGYFDALAIPIIRGRGITSDDRTSSPSVVVINDAMRRKFWPDRDPVGQRIRITRDPTGVWREIVGIVGDIRHSSLASEPQPEMYVPYSQDPTLFLRIAVRSHGPHEAIARAMRAAVWALDPTQPVSRLRPMSEVVAGSVAPHRFNAVLIAAFATLALLLAAIGLYGVLAYSVTLRLREFGVRVALGADRTHLIRMVLGQGLTLGVAGLGIGLVFAWATSKAIDAQFYGVTRTDPVTVAGVTGILLIVALVASCLPARRASRADPMSTLRAE